MQNKIYYKIGEVCELTGLKPSVVRFWEKEFRQLKPVKLSSNQRYYTVNHIELLNRIKHLLYEEKMTIEGARKKLREQTVDEKLLEVKKELLSILEDLRKY
jgi:DNA-binding transcriptional MerR regulator